MLLLIYGLEHEIATEILTKTQRFIVTETQHIEGLSVTSTVDSRYVVSLRDPPGPPLDMDMLMRRPMVVRLYLRSPFKQLYLRHPLRASEAVEYYDRMAEWHKKYPPSCRFTLSELLGLFSLSLSQVGADVLLVVRKSDENSTRRQVSRACEPVSGPNVADWLIVSHVNLDADPGVNVSPPERCYSYYSNSEHSPDQSRWEANESCGVSCTSFTSSASCHASDNEDLPGQLDSTVKVATVTTIGQSLSRGKEDATKGPREDEGPRADPEHHSISKMDNLVTPRCDSSESESSISRSSLTLSNRKSALPACRLHGVDPLPGALTECIRLSWDSYFTRLAEYTSKRSNCRKRRVGALLVRDRRIISAGYNGTSFTSENCLEGGCARCQQPFIRAGQLLDRCECIHAEVNALLGVKRELTHGSSMFVNLMPCFSCAKLIVQMGISRVVYIEDYDGRDATLYMKKHHVIVSKHPVSSH